MNFGQLALVVAAGLLGPLLASAPRFGPPVVVGQIVAGVAIGTSGLRWVEPNHPVLNGLALIGFALLMFVVGTHLPVRDERLRSAFALGTGAAATVGVLATSCGLLLAPVVGLDRPGLLTVLIASSSGAVALPILQGLGAWDQPALLTTVWIAVTDVGTVLALPLVLATGSVTRVVAGGALVVSAGLVLFAVVHVLRGQRWVRTLRNLSRDRGWGLDLRVSLLALFVCAWIATRFGTSILIAGFTVGVVVALLGEPRRVAQQLVGLGEGFLIPVFFVHLGTQLDLDALVHSASALALAGALAGVAIAVHVATALVWRLPIGMGLLASAQLGVPAAVVSIGLETEQLTPAQGAAVMASVLATLLACAIGGALVGLRVPIIDASAPIRHEDRPDDPTADG